MDVREDPALDIPPVLPCAITHPGSVPGEFREAVGTLVQSRQMAAIARRPTVLKNATPHCLGTAANISRIGDHVVDSRERDRALQPIARQTLPGIWTRPYGTTTGMRGPPAPRPWYVTVGSTGCRTVDEHVTEG